MRRGEADFWIASDALDYNAIWTSCRWKTVNIRFFLNRYFPFRDRARTDLIKSDDQHYDVCSIGSGVRYQIFRNRKISDSSFYFVPNFNFQFCHMLRILNVETKYFISRKECDFPLSMWTYFNILIFRKNSLLWLCNIVISWPIFSSVDTADIWFPTPPGTPAMSTRASSRTASIHSSSRPSSVASYVSFQRSNNPQPRSQESPYKSGQRHMVRARLHADG